MPSLISNQKCAMSRSGAFCLSADFARIVYRWVRIMWKKTCFLVRGGAYAFEKLAKLHCVQPVPRLIHGTSTLTTQSTYDRLPVASRRTWGPIDNTPLYLIWGPGLLSATKLPPWQSLSPACSWCPRNAKLVMASVLTMFMIRRRSFRQKVASVSIACSWTRSVRCPAFHRPKAMLTSRCAWVFSCYMIFTPKFFGLPDSPVAPVFELPMAAEQPTSFD